MHNLLTRWMSRVDYKQMLMAKIYIAEKKGMRHYKSYLEKELALAEL